LQKEQNRTNREAYVEGLDSDQLFLSLFDEDVDGKKLNKTPGADLLLADFHDKFVVICKKMYEFGKVEKEVRDKEVQEFWKCLSEAKNANTIEATAHIEAFNEYKKKVYIYSNYASSPYCKSI